MQQTITDAMSLRHLLTFDYDGHPRTVIPDALYREEQQRKVVLHAWQTRGGTYTCVPPCWGKYRLDKLLDLKVLDEGLIGAQSDFSSSRFEHLIQLLSSYSVTLRREFFIDRRPGIVEGAVRRRSPSQYVCARNDNRKARIGCLDLMPGDLDPDRAFRGRDPDGRAREAFCTH